MINEVTMFIHKSTSHIMQTHLQSTVIEMVTLDKLVWLLPPAHNCTFCRALTRH